MLAVDMARLLPLTVDQIRDDVLLPPPHQALPDLSLSPLSNATVVPYAHIIHFFRSASFTMATSKHLRTMLSGTSQRRLLPGERSFGSSSQIMGSILQVDPHNTEFF